MTVAVRPDRGRTGPGGARLVHLHTRSARNL